MIVISSFDQFANHTVELAKLITAYYANLKIKDTDLKRGLIINFQQTLLSLGILGIGQPIISDDDDLEFDDMQ